MTDFDWIRDLIVEMYDNSVGGEMLDELWRERFGNA